MLYADYKRGSWRYAFPLISRAICSKRANANTVLVSRVLYDISSKPPATIEME